MILSISVLNGYFHVNIKDEISTINLFELKNMKEFHLKELQETWYLEPTHNHVMYMKDEVLEHYYGVYNSVVVASYYNSALYGYYTNIDAQLLSTSFILGYGIKSRDDLSICIKINNKYWALFDAAKENLVDEDLIYFIHCENAKFFKFEPQEKGDKIIF